MAVNVDGFDVCMIGGPGLIGYHYGGLLGTGIVLSVLAAITILTYHLAEEP